MFFTIRQIGEKQLTTNTDTFIVTITTCSSSQKTMSTTSSVIEFDSMSLSTQNVAGEASDTNMLCKTKK